MCDKPLLTIEDVAKHFKVSTSTARAWVRQGYIPKSTYIKIGNTYRFDIDKIVAALIAASATPPAPPAGPEDPVSPVQLELDLHNPDNDL